MRNVNSSSDEYRSLRERYNPIEKGRKIRVLFIAESPPKPSKSEQPYFYNKNSKRKGLWWHLSQVLYDGEMNKKEEFLERFQEDGYFLIDIFSTKQELDDILKKKSYTEATRISQRLFNTIQRLEPGRVVLLGKRAAKLIAGCLPFGSETNVERFRNFVKASIKD